MFHYALQKIDTGEELVSGYSEKSMVSWQKSTEKKFLKDKRRSEDFKQAILDNNTIVALLNYEEVQDTYHKALRGYDKYFNLRLGL